jgi:nucleotide-binding universal stress UspA family protein
MKILVAYDGSISADAAIRDLRRAGLPENAEALVLSVADDGLHPTEIHAAAKPDHDRSWRSRLAEAESLAENAGERIRAGFPQWTVSSEALQGSPAKVILDTSAWWRPDLLVVGSHGRSRIARLFLGSVSLELVHKATCPVRVARPREPFDPGSPIRIIIGHDGSPEAENVVRSVTARSWPEKTEAQIIAVVQTLAPVVDDFDASTFAQEPAYALIREADERNRCRMRNIASESANCLRRAGLVVSCTVADADPREVLAAVAEQCNADTIFVGARGVGRMERLLLGSVSSYVVTHAHCTVEVVRDPRGAQRSK